MSQSVANERRTPRRAAEETLDLSPLQRYEADAQAARSRYAQESGAAVLFNPNVDPRLLELFLVHFSSRSVAITAPVEGWLMRSSQACERVAERDGSAAVAGLARFLRLHSSSEAGHDQMHVADTHALVKRWNARQSTPMLDAAELLSRPPTHGGAMYCRLHEDTLASERPWCQIAIEYEIERLAAEFGPPLIGQIIKTLGKETLACCSFLVNHITLDSFEGGHSEQNQHHIKKLLAAHPEFLDPLVQAGSRALEAFATHFRNCLDLALAENNGNAECLPREAAAGNGGSR
jgi:hypothetical protein